MSMLTSSVGRIMIPVVPVATGFAVSAALYFRAQKKAADLAYSLHQKLPNLQNNTSACHYALCQLGAMRIVERNRNLMLAENPKEIGNFELGLLKKVQAEVEKCLRYQPYQQARGFSAEIYPRLNPTDPNHPFNTTNPDFSSSFIDPMREAAERLSTCRDDEVGPYVHTLIKKMNFTLNTRDKKNQPLTFHIGSKLCNEPETPESLLNRYFDKGPDYFSSAEKILEKFDVRPLSYSLPAVIGVVAAVASRVLL